MNWLWMGVVMAPMVSALSAGDAGHLERFVAAKLPAESWDHEAHLRVAYGLARSYQRDEALLRMRAGIFALNAAHGTPNTTTRGYHETLTVAWLDLVAAAVRETDAPTFDDLLQRKPDLLSATALLGTHYTPETLFSLTARARFVPPDLRPLPSSR